MGFLHQLLGTSMNNIISCLFHSIEYRLFRTILRCLLGFRGIRQLLWDISDLPPLDFWLLPSPCSLHSTLQGGATEFCALSSKLILLQYLGMCLLFLHIRKKEDLKLDMKEKILMIVSAPFMQMIFLVSFIYYWSKGDTKKQVELIFRGIVFLFCYFRGSSISSGSS